VKGQKHGAKSLMYLPKKHQAARPDMVKAGLPESQSLVGMFPGRFDLLSRIAN
jgi:hypothetical protein